MMTLFLLKGRCVNGVFASGTQAGPERTNTFPLGLDFVTSLTRTSSLFQSQPFMDMSCGTMLLLSRNVASWPACECLCEAEAAKCPLDHPESQ